MELEEINGTEQTLRVATLECEIAMCDVYEGLNSGGRAARRSKGRETGEFLWVRSGTLAVPAGRSRKHSFAVAKGYRGGVRQIRTIFGK